MTEASGRVQYKRLETLMKNLEPGGDHNERTDPQGRLAGVRILVAEDDLAARVRLVAALLAEGGFVYEPAVGDELLVAMQGIALDSWPPDRVDLLVMDARRPGLSGLELLRKLRERRWRTPVILSSEPPVDGIADEILSLDALLLPKPFSPEAMIDAALTALPSSSRGQPQTPPQAPRGDGRYVVGGPGASSSASGERPRLRTGELTAKPA